MLMFGFTDPGMAPTSSLIQQQYAVKDQPLPGTYYDPATASMTFKPGSGTIKPSSGATSNGLTPWYKKGWVLGAIGAGVLVIGVGVWALR